MFFFASFTVIYGLLPAKTLPDEVYLYIVLDISEEPEKSSCKTL